MSNENAKVILKGIVRFPKKEDGVWTAQLVLDSYKEAKKLVEACQEAYPKLTPIEPKYDEEAKEYSINIKSRYDFTVINTDSTKCEEPIYHGADMRVKLSLSDYNYKGKKGVTSYIHSALMVKNGEVKKLSAADFFEEDEQLPF